MNQQEMRLLNNTIIFAIGSFGSKVISFLIVPMYSYFIDTESFGIYDLIITTVMMLTPILSLQMSDGVYRWLIDEPDNKGEIISSTIKLLLLCILIATWIYYVWLTFVNFSFAVETWMYTVTTIIYSVVQQMIRGLRENKLYSFTGILYTVIHLMINLLGLTVLNSGIRILFYSSSIASTVCCGIFLHKLKITETIKIKSNIKLLRKIIRYSLPLIPNTICWWVVNSIDRYMIRFYLGPDANGIYSMSTKYPAIVTMITGIFYMAWQESAIKEYNTPNRNQFFSAVFNKYNKLLFSTVIICIPFIKYFIMMAMEQSYKVSWKYTGFIMIGCSFSALCSFLGIGYNISKDTKNALYTTFIAAITDVVLNLFLMKQYGLQIASFSTLVSYVLLFAIRLIDCKKYFILEIRWKEFTILSCGSIVVFAVSFILSAKKCLMLTIFLGIGWIVYNRELFTRYGREIIPLILTRHNAFPQMKQ